MHCIAKSHSEKIYLVPDYKVPIRKPDHLLVIIIKTSEDNLK